MGSRGAVRLKWLNGGDHLGPLGQVVSGMAMSVLCGIRDALNSQSADINFLMVPVGVFASDKVSAECYGNAH